MILQFKAKNFRSYKNEMVFSMIANSSDSKSFNYCETSIGVTQSVKALKLAMIYGANASGKTNVIRAMYELFFLIQHKPKVDQTLRIYDPFRLDDDSSDDPSEFYLEFLGPDSVKYAYTIHVREDTILKEELDYFPNGKITKVFKRLPFNSEKTVQSGELGSGFGKKKIDVFKNQLLLSKFGDDEPHETISKVFQYFNKINIINATNEKHLETIERTTSEALLGNERLLRKVKRLIKSADSQIEDIDIVKQIFGSKGTKIRTDVQLTSNPYEVKGLYRKYRKGVDSGYYPMDFRNWSHGTQSIYKLGGEIILTLEKGGILIIDELDTSLHPFLTKLIVMLFQSSETNPQNAQLIFTTHDVTLLDRDLIRRDQVWLAEKSERGATDLYSLQDFEDVREDTPFEKWYLAGKFGGIPKMNSVDSIFQFD